MMNKIRNVAVITPRCKENLAQVLAFRSRLSLANAELAKNGKQIKLTHYLLNDGDQSLVESYSNHLVNHETNRGLAYTLVEGYEAVLKIPDLDLIVRIDIDGEHDIGLLPYIISTMEQPKMGQTQVQALYLPVVSSIEGKPRPNYEDVTRDIAQFGYAVKYPEDQGEVIRGLYNQRFPLGYQVYYPELLRQITPDLRRGLTKFKEITGKEPTWGLDLLAILLAAKSAPIDFIFGGWMKPWEANRSPQKDLDQAERAKVMLQIFDDIKNNT